MTTILKKLRHLPMLGLVAAAAVLSVVLGCGGSETGNSAPNNAVTIDLAGTIDTEAGDSVSTVGFTILNSSNGSISDIIYYNAEGDPVTKRFDPLVAPGRSIAVIARVKVSRVTNSTNNGGGTTSTTTYTSTTNAITVIISSTSSSNKTYTLGVSVDATTGAVKLTGNDTTVVYTGN